MFCPVLIEFDPLVSHHQLLGLEIGLRQRNADLLRIGGTGAVDRIQERKEALHVARAGVVKIAAGLGLVHLVDLVGGRLWLADRPGAAIHRTLCNVKHCGDERRIGKTAVVTDHHRRLVVEILHRLHVKDQIRGVADEDDDVGIFLLELQHLRGDVRRARAVGDADRDRDVRILGFFGDRFRDRGAIVGVLVDDSDRSDLLAGLFHVGEEPHVGAGIVAGDRCAAEHPFEPAPGDIERGRFTDHERDAVTLGNRGRREAARRLVCAEHDVHLVLRDQARGELLRERGIALVVGKNQLDFRAAEIGQTRGLGEGQIAELGMRVIDNLSDELGRRLGRLARGAGIAGERPRNANFDGLGGCGRTGGVEQSGRSHCRGEQGRFAFQGSLPSGFNWLCQSCRT